MAQPERLLKRPAVQQHGRPDPVPEQDEWIDGAAAAAGVSLPGFISRLIEDARLAAASGRQPTTVATAVGRT